MSELPTAGGGQGASRSKGPWRRLAAVPVAARLSVRMERARRSESTLLARLGETVRTRESSSGDEDARATLAETARLEAELAAVRDAAAASLDQDRDDYPSATSWTKPVVVVRGLLTRLVLRDRARRIGQALRPLHRALGAALLDGRLQAPGGSTRPGSEGLAREVAEQRRRFDEARAERLRLLAPWDVKALPGWARRALDEAAAAGTAIGKEARVRLLPRLPGLVGLAAGWWVAHAFTASYWDRLKSGFGLQSGGPRVVSEDTYRHLQFWVPLLAAAACAYLGSRLSASMDRRYLRQPAPGQPPPPRVR